MLETVPAPVRAPNGPLVMPSTLLFPSSTPDALSYYRTALAHGQRVVAASSLGSDATAGAFETWIHLPGIYEPTFTDRFLEAIEEHDIGQIYSPVASVYFNLKHVIRDLDLDVVLLGEGPLARQMTAYGELLSKAGDAARALVLLSRGRSTLSKRQVAAILRHADTIYGETDHNKIIAMMGIFASAPPGDVVEIGALMGKSAFVMAYLARHYGIGPLLTVDPWRAENSPEVVQSLPDLWDLDLVADAFYINLLPVRGPAFGHLRMPSVKAYEHYREGRPVETPDFGSVTFSGQISVIHIDGNHDFDAVATDCRLWLPHLRSGGWLILDDYVWSHGDGPRRVGDTLLDSRSEDISHAFVCGKALFAQLE